MKNAILLVVAIAALVSCGAGAYYLTQDSEPEELPILYYEASILDKEWIEGNAHYYHVLIFDFSEYVGNGEVSVWCEPCPTILPHGTHYEEPTGWDYSLENMTFMSKKYQLVEGIPKE